LIWQLVKAAQFTQQLFDPRPVLLLRLLLHHRIVQVLQRPERVARVFCDESPCETSSEKDFNTGDYVHKIKSVRATWVAFFLEGVKSESIDATRRAGELLALRETYRDQLQSDGSAGRVLARADQLFLWPAITIPRARDVLGLTYEGAKKNVVKLEAKGLLAKLPNQQRNQIWIARPIIALMS
jgi:hypothetical protein